MSLMCSLLLWRSETAPGRAAVLCSERIVPGGTYDERKPVYWIWVHMGDVPKSSLKRSPYDAPAIGGYDIPEIR